RGLHSFMVEVGGEIRVGRRRPDGARWRIAIERPMYSAANTKRRMQHILNVENTAVATSGDYRNFFESQGRRYSHILDPRTGRPVTTGIVSATVVGPSCALADGLATTLLVLSPTEGLQLLRKFPAYHALLMVRTRG